MSPLLSHRSDIAGIHAGSAVPRRPLGVRIVAALATAAAVLAGPAAGVLAAAPAAAESLERTFGRDRIATAVAASAEHRVRADDVLLATAEDFPDALAAGSLAGDLDAPVLLTEPTSLPEQVRAELARLAVRRVWVLGGPRAVGEPVVQDLRAQGYAVQRIAEASRYGTARAIALQAGAPTGEAVVALGEHTVPERAWADAVAAGALAAAPGHLPILLTRSQELPVETLDALERLRVRTVLLLGGTAAVGDAVQQRLGALGYDVERLAGASRYETSMAAAADALERFGPGSHPVVFASGEGFPDALAAGALAADLGGPLVLVPPSALGRSVETWLRDRDWTGGVVVGGPAAASERVVRQLDRALRDVPTADSTTTGAPTTGSLTGSPTTGPPAAGDRPADAPQHEEGVVGVFQGRASWYGPGFQGAPTASGERFDRGALTAAHPELPFGTRLRVTNLTTGAQVVVRINDRGPHHGDRVLDLAEAAAEVIGLKHAGTARVRAEVLAG